MKKLTDFQVIQIFTIIHVIVALLSRILGLSDELILTMLTMLLSVILCWRRHVGLTTMAIILIFVNIAGLFLSRAFGSLLRLFFEWNRMISGPVVVLFTTEIIGAGVLCIISVVKKVCNIGNNRKIGVIWLFFAFLMILVVRLVLIFMQPDDNFAENLEVNVFIDYLFSCAVVFYMAYYSIKAESSLVKEREKAHKAQYDYLKLKQQVEPHFMFNNLNVLDELVCDGKTEAASKFIHKLASTYRYMSGNEVDVMVPLREEMNFVEEYVDLLKVRFEGAIVIDVDIPDSMTRAYVVPCSVQLLVENAIKHNVASSGDPLIVKIKADERLLVVTNELRPKLGPINTAGIGLRYIQQQYRDLTGKDIDVLSCNGEFIVKLPLIYGSADSRR